MKVSFSPKPLSLPLASLLLISIGSLGMFGCAELGDSYYPSSRPGYYDGGNRRDPYYDNSDYYRHRERIRDEKRDIREERERLEEERERLERERRHRDSVYRMPPPPSAPPARVQESCPPGFSPSERKCTNDERRRGCKDMRLPGGLGCVHR